MKPMMAIVLRAPYALLAAEGIKTFETRTYTPNPERLAEGDRLAIVSGLKVLRYKDAPEAWDRLAAVDDDGRTGEEIASAVGVLGPGCRRWPTGHVLAAPVYGGSLPIVDRLGYRPERRYIVANPLAHALRHVDRHRVGLNVTDAIHDQWHLGHWSHGRRAWPLAGAAPLAHPVPIGAVQPDGSRISMQGVFTLPDDIANAVSNQIKDPAP